MSRHIYLIIITYLLAWGPLDFARAATSVSKLTAPTFDPITVTVGQVTPVNVSFVAPPSPVIPRSAVLLQRLPPKAGSTRPRYRTVKTLHLITPASTGATDTGTIEVVARSVNTLAYIVRYRGHLSPIGDLDAAAASIASMPDFITPATDAHDIRLDSSGTPAVVNRAFVMFKEGTTPDDMQAAITSAGGIPVGRLAPLNTIIANFPTASSFDDLDAILAHLATDPAVSGTSHVHSAQSTGSVDDTALLPDHAWAFQNTDAFNAWNRIQQAGLTPKTVVVAVLDTGISKSHPEFTTLLLPSISFVTRVITDPWAHRIPIAVETVDQNDDERGHGTAVAGIIGALNNGTGLNGILGPLPSVQNGEHPYRLLSVKVCSRYVCGDCPLDAVLAGIYYTLLQPGVKVINLSLAGGASDLEQQLWRHAVASAEAKGILVVAGAGNSDIDASTVFPAAVPGVVSVGAVTRNNLPSWWTGPFTGSCGNRIPTQATDFGPSVSVYAPGGGRPFSNHAQNLGPNIYTTALDGGYNDSFAGTSAATPFVSGAAGLLFALGGDKVTLEQVRTWLTDGDAHDIGGKYGQIRTLNLEKAVDSLLAAVATCDPPCDNGVFCDGQETCQNGSCVSGAPPDCSLLSDQCNSGMCSEVAKACIKQPKQTCGDGMIEPECGEQCDPTASPNGCASGETCASDCTHCTAIPQPLTVTWVNPPPSCLVGGDSLADVNWRVDAGAPIKWTNLWWATDPSRLTNCTPTDGACSLPEPYCCVDDSSCNQCPNGCVSDIFTADTTCSEANCSPGTLTLCHAPSVSVPTTYYFTAYAQTSVSGEFAWAPSLPVVVNPPGIACGSSLPFQVGDTVVALFPLTVRDSPDINSNGFAFVVAGTTGVVLDGPTADSGTTPAWCGLPSGCIWWRIRYNDGFGTIGWSADADNTLGRHLVKVETIHVSDTVMALVPLTVRDSPDINANALQFVVPSTTGSILDGPIADSGATPAWCGLPSGCIWWRIRYNDGLNTTGWSAEGDSVQRYLAKVDAGTP